MDTKGTASGRARTPRRWMGAAGLLGAGLLAGGILAGSHIAGAASPTNPNTATATASSGRVDPATMAHGPGETLLTGTTAAKVTAAAKAAVPVQRSSGSRPMPRARPTRPT